MKRQPKVLFISSTGGHFHELMRLRPLFSKYNTYIATEKQKTNDYLKDEFKNKVFYLLYGTKDHPISYPFKLLINCFISLFYFIKIRPDCIVTTGTHTAGPICCIAKIFGKKVIYIETIANINSKTITGRLIYHIADLFLVQWESMLKLYPKAIYKGWIY